MTPCSYQPTLFESHPSGVGLTTIATASFTASLESLDRSHCRLQLRTARAGICVVLDLVGVVLAVLDLNSACLITALVALDFVRQLDKLSRLRGWPHILRLHPILDRRPLARAVAGRVKHFDSELPVVLAELVRRLRGRLSRLS